MATQLFNFNCESGTLANFYNANVHGASTISTTQAHGGTKSIRYAPSDFTSMNNDLVMEIPNVFAGTSGNFVNWTTKLTEIYLSFWIYIDSGINVTSSVAGNHMWRLKADGATGTIQMDTQTGSGNPSGGVFSQDLALLDPSLPSGGYSVHTEFGSYVYTVSLDTWTHIEMQAILNTTYGGTAASGNGTLKFWKNGVISFNRTGNIQLRGSGSSNTGWNAYAQNTNWDSGVPHAVNTEWYHDDIEIWDGVPSAPTFTIDDSAHEWQPREMQTNPLTISKW